MWLPSWKTTSLHARPPVQLLSWRSSWLSMERQLLFQLYLQNSLELTGSTIAYYLSVIARVCDLWTINTAPLDALKWKMAFLFGFDTAVRILDLQALNITLVHKMTRHSGILGSVYGLCGQESDAWSSFRHLWYKLSLLSWVNRIKKISPMPYMSLKVLHWPNQVVLAESEETVFSL